MSDGAIAAYPDGEFPDVMQMDSGFSNAEVLHFQRAAFIEGSTSRQPEVEQYQRALMKTAERLDASQKERVRLQGVIEVTIERVSAALSYDGKRSQPERISATQHELLDIKTEGTP